MASMNTRLNIEKLDGNFVQKHGGSKQVGFKQLGPGVETGVHGVHDKKNVFGLRWNCKELKGIVKLRFFRTGRKIKTGNVLDSYNQRSTQQFWSVQGSLGRGYNHVYISSEQGHHHLRLKTPIDMLGFFGWLASIKQGMLEPVKVVLYRNMGFNESGEYKKTFIGSGVGTGSMQENVDQGAGLQEVQTQDLMDYQLARDREQHLACELFGYREDSNEAAFAVAAVEKIYAHESLTFNDTVACEVISKWKVGLKDNMDARSNVYVLSNGYKKCNDDSDGYYWESTPGMFIHSLLYIDGMVYTRSGLPRVCWLKQREIYLVWRSSGIRRNTLRVSQSRIYNEKLVQTLLKGHSTLSLEDSLSGDCDVEKNDAGILDKFDRGLQTGVQVFVDFDYALGRSITVMGRSITRHELMILGCVRSLKANLQHVEALSTTEMGYMTFTKAWKKEIWLKGLLTESVYELTLIAGIATGALVKGCSRSEVPAQVKVGAYLY
ncbi:hypothetical protein Tco_1028166 [Tanacetum coccineum]